MQQKIIDGFLQGLLDPRFQGLVTEFYMFRSRLTIIPNGKLMHTVQAVLHTLSTVLEDQYSVREMQIAMNGSSLVLPDVDPEELLSCLNDIQSLVAGPAFTDTAVVLFIFCKKLDLNQENVPGLDASEVLGRLEDFLSVLGLRDISLKQLWDNAEGELAEHRTLIFQSVMAMLNAVQKECHLDG